MKLTTLRSVLLLTLLSTSALAAPVQPHELKMFTRYDAAMQDASRRFLPLWDWRLLKAQLYQESRLDPSVCSSVGACGLGQFMPQTWTEVQVSLAAPRELSARFMPSYSITAAAYYDAKLRAIWRSDRSESDRTDLVLASYNAGAGNILRAQRACGACSSWSEISAHLIRVTGRHSAETITYVERIRRWHGYLTK